MAVGAVLAGARQLAAIAIVAGRAGLIAMVARPAWLAGASSGYRVAAEQMRGWEDSLVRDAGLSRPLPTPSLNASVVCQTIPRPCGLTVPRKLRLMVAI